MSDTLLLGAAGLLIGAVAVTIGYAVGAGMCRRMVRRELWRMFEALEPVGDTPYTLGAIRWDVLNLIKRLEL